MTTDANSAGDGFRLMLKLTRVHGFVQDVAITTTGSEKNPTTEKPNERTNPNSCRRLHTNELPD